MPKIVWKLSPRRYQTILLLFCIILTELSRNSWHFHSFGIGSSRNCKRFRNEFWIHNTEGIVYVAVSFLHQIPLFLVSLFVSQIIQANLRDDLVAHWKFDEGKRGTTKDSAHRIEGKIEGKVSWIEGKHRTALKFDNSDSVNLMIFCSIYSCQIDRCQAWYWFNVGKSFLASDRLDHIPHC